MTIFVYIMTNKQNTTGPQVVALIYDGLCTFEFGIASEIFGLYRPEMGESWYRFASCAIEPGPLRAQGGLLVEASANAAQIDTADVIVVPGWKGADAPVPVDLIRQLQTAHARGARLVSICSGAFVLAATGLLDGNTATTHWRYAEQLRSQYPAIDVDEKSLYRTSNRIYTSAGSAAGMDLLIQIVREDFGMEAANSVARRLVLPAHRTGGQAQFLERPVSIRIDSPIASLLDSIRTTLDQIWSIPLMAQRCGMSARTFLRRFTEATGTTPGEWLVAERVERAKFLLSMQQRGLEDIAQSVGFGSADTLRHHFRNRIGISPSEYRSRFGSG
jgi:AraC family transcriptional regulator, transcriptional activator FtrA